MTPPRRPLVRLVLTLDRDDVELLEVLGRSDAVTSGDVVHVLMHLAASAADGVRRPGAWERSWVEQCFGVVRSDAVEQDPEIPYHVRPVRR